MFHQFDFFISQDVASCDCATDCRSFRLAVCIILRACESLSPDVFHHSVRMSEWVGLQVFPPQLVNEWRSVSVQLWMCVQVYWAILSLWNQITMWLNEHPLSEDTSEWVSVCASLCVRLLIMTYSYPCSYIHLLTNLGASGMSACALYSAKRCDHAIMKLLTFGAKSQFQQCAANRCRMAPHFSLHFQIVAFRFSESYNPRAQVRFVI